MDPVPAQPKRFAACINVFMGVVAFSMWWGLYYTNNKGALPWIMVMFLIILWVDTFVGFCPGCFMYAYILAPYDLYFPSSLKDYRRIKGEDEVLGIYYRWLPHCYLSKIDFKGSKHQVVQSGASKWRTHCENGICKLIRVDDAS